MVSWLLTLVAADLRGASARAFGVRRFRIGVRLFRVFIHSAGPAAPNQSPDPSPRLNLLILKKFWHQAGSLLLRHAGQTGRPCREKGQNKKPG
jgi:hypothetical protein